jgi:hypothetical protein
VIRVAPLVTCVASTNVFRDRPCYRGQRVIRVAPLVTCVAPTNVFRDCPCYRGQRQPRERIAAGPRYVLLLTWRCSVAFKAIELYCPV